MSDLLSAASLLMAVIAILYALWYPEIITALNIKPHARSVDNKVYLKQTRGIFWSKSIPLSLMAIVVSLVFVTDALKIIISSVKLLNQSGVETYYDAVKMSYVIVFIFSCILSVYIVSLSVSLNGLIKKLT